MKDENTDQENIKNQMQNKSAGGECSSPNYKQDKKMKKANLIVIAFTSLVLIFTTNAFGQWHKDFPLGVKSPRQTTKQKVKGKNPSGVITELGMPALSKTKIQQTGANANNRRKYKPKVLKEPTSVEVPNLIKAKTKNAKPLYDWHDDFRRKQPRKRQRKP